LNCIGVKEGGNWADPGPGKKNSHNFPYSSSGLPILLAGL